MMRIALLAGVLGWLLASAPASAQTLGVSNGAFTIDGTPTFLVFVSYFDGVRRIPDDLRTTAVLDADLAECRARGIGGVRVFPNWTWPADTLMDERGALRPLQVEKLKRLVARAAVHRIVVDVSFARETVSGLDVARYRDGIAAAAAALKGRGNILFDLQNEAELHGLGPEDLKAMRDAVKRIDPGRLVTASTGGGRDPDDSARAVGAGGLDVLAYHDARDAEGRWAEATGSVVGRLRLALERAGLPGVPIYLQEPNRFGANRAYYDSTSAHYLTAVRQAKAAGAAAWTFHTDPFRRLDGSRPFRSLLEAGERRVFDGLRDAAGR